MPLSSTTNIASGAASRRSRKFASTHSGRLILSCRIERSWLIFEIAWPHFGVRYTWAFEPKKMAVQWLESLACWGIGDSFIRKYPASIWKRELYKIPIKSKTPHSFEWGVSVASTTRRDLGGEMNNSMFLGIRFRSRTTRRIGTLELFFNAFDKFDDGQQICGQFL